MSASTAVAEDRLSPSDEADGKASSIRPFPYLTVIGLSLVVGIGLGLSWAAFKQRMTISAPPESYRGDIPLEIAAVHARLELLEREVSTLRETVAKVAPEPPKPASPPAAGPPVYGLYVASYRLHEAAMSGWEVLNERYPAAFANSTPLLLPVETAGGIFVRLIAEIGQRDPLAACDQLSQSGLHCKPVRLR